MERQSITGVCFQSVCHYIEDTYYQVYVNRKGIPHSRDKINVERSYNYNYSMFSYYYQWYIWLELSSSYVLSDCNAVDAGYQCVSTCDSVWFKIDNKTEADYYVKYCDPIFQEKYGDITWDFLKRVNNRKHNCTGSLDPFGFIIQQIGKTTTETIEMSKNWIKIIYRQKGKWLLLLRDT